MKRSIYGHANGLGRDISRTDVTFTTNGIDARVGWQVHPHNSAWSVDADAYFVRRQKRVATRFTRGREDATPGYALLDVGADWQFAPQHTLRLALKNLSDKRYHEHLAQGISGNELLAAGRSVQLSWQGSF
ncbi:MAG: TonB-dependent receptor [Lautropia sp.]|nr:TonB-dependent receptor [Lautropia sp.]